MNKDIALVLMSLLITACSPGGSSYPITPDFIKKGPLAFTGYGESAPFVWQNSLYYMQHQPDNRIKIWEVSGATQPIYISPGLKYPSIYVENGVAHIFGSTNNWASIATIKSNDLVNWTSPQVIVLPEPGGTVYNSSVASDTVNGGYILTYELSGPSTLGTFNAVFAHSNDLSNWTKITGQYKAGQYSACSTIRAVNDYYYLFYLAQYPPNDGTGRRFFATKLTRSKDLVNWEDSDTIVLSPFGDNEPEARNASDMDLVEYEGTVHIIYTNTAQDGILPAPNPLTGWRTAIYQGPLAEFVERFFLHY